MSAIVTDEPQALSFRIRGVVQGVGFRPTVARVANALTLTGHVVNDGDGVRVFVEGRRAPEFQSALLDAIPPLARVDEIEVREVNRRGYDSFEIRPSEEGPARTSVVADSAMCPACWDEVKSPYERRYRYPFANCTHCGPRFSIIEAMPYDRARTTMASFEMCSGCRSEYEDERDRRYHAQPIACHRCGPRAWLERGDGAAVVSDMFSGLDDVDAIATLLKQGEIVAIRSVGGYHLACDATQPLAVEKLRAGKARETKPFAVMVRDLDVLRAYASVSEAERALLESPAGPIVLLERQPGADKPLAESVAPGTELIGAMLPYTPMHGLIMKRMNVPVVMTSGNVHGEPQCIEVAEAMERLGSITPWFLHHNRDIVDRIDDSVTRVIGGAPTVLRRGRGYAPEGWSVPGVSGHGLAMGGDLKSAFAIASGEDLVLSHHIGDLDEPRTRDDYERAIDRYLELFDVPPEWIAVDEHPSYASRGLGEVLAHRLDVPVVSVQHHHAHVAACLADHSATGPVVGVVLDGIGWGSDESAWGGEIMIADYTRFERVAALAPSPLLGGDRAAREPWRNAYAQLANAVGWDTLGRASPASVQAIVARRTPQLDAALEQGRFVQTSSAGRLFDAVAAVLGLYPDAIHHEAQAAMALEALATKASPEDGYRFSRLVTGPDMVRIDPTPMWRSLLADLEAGVAPAQIAMRFHRGLASAFAVAAMDAARAEGIDTVALSGGCMANRILVEALVGDLEAAGLRVLTHRRTPTGDGGLALGQLAIAATMKGVRSCV